MKKQLSIWATQEEVAKLELIRNFHKRNTLSDTLRHLINSEHEKIFLKIISNETNNEEINSFSQGK
ncbi:MAG: hypothetical protein IKC77_07065 [Lentisphaeria bacterium]|nr:hypothetical protein [Lentisphaeria bacterium]